MRTLKKTLCLVLALAMMVGLCAVGASAITVDDYKDKDQIPNMEAFATLTAIGVFQGDDKGNVNPTASLTRAEGATVVAKMAQSAGNGVSSFTDMATAAWAQGAVAYCEANGIINGYGDGRFGPSDPLSEVAFAKMCLTSLGYDAVREGLTGSQWEINTIKLVNKLDLAAGIATLDWNGACPRWVAAQFAFNTLKATMVEYDGGLNVTTPDGTKVEVGANANPLINTSYSYTNTPGTWNGITGSGDYTMQFCENYFPNLKLGTKNDDYRMPTNYWYNGDNRKDVNLTDAKVITKSLAGTAMATYTTSMFVTSKALFEATKEGSKNSVTLSVYENGADATAIPVTKNDGASYPLLKYAGATVYLIDTDKEGTEGYGIADTLIVKYPLLAKVAKVNKATATAPRSINLEVYKAEISGDKLTGKTFKDSVTGFVTEQYAARDYVLIYPSVSIDAAQAKDAVTKDNIIEIEMAESVAGKLTKVAQAGTAASALTLDGVAYSIGAAKLANLGPNNFVTGTAPVNYQPLNGGLTAYTSNGFVLGTVSDTVALSDYVFVAGSTENQSAFGDNSVTAGYVKQDATSYTATAYNDTGFTCKKDMVGWFTAIDMGSTTGFIQDTKYSVTEEIASLKKDQPQLTTGTYKLVADAKTVFIIRTAAGFKAYTGIANVPEYKSFESGTKAYGLRLTPTTACSAVFIDARKGTGATDTRAPIFVYTGTPSGQQIEGKYTVNVFKAVVAGEDTTVNAIATLTSIPAGLVIPTFDANNFVSAYTATLDTKLYPIQGLKGAVSVRNSNITVAGSAYTFAADTLAYVYENRTLSIVDASTLDDYTSATVWAAATSESNKTLKALYIIVG